MDIILDTSGEAAKFVENISGWVSRDGLFFGKDERAARYKGSTHRVCECGKPAEKIYTHCASCREKRAIERHNNRERVEWDGETPIYSDSADRYFYSIEEVDDYLYDTDTTRDDLRLLLCEPVFLSRIDDDRWCDDLPEEGALPDEVKAALDNLNEVLLSVGPVSWKPGKKAVALGGLSAAS